VVVLADTVATPRVLYHHLVNPPSASKPPTSLEPLLSFRRGTSAARQSSTTKCVSPVHRAIGLYPSAVQLPPLVDVLIYSARRAKVVQVVYPCRKFLLGARVARTVENAMQQTSSRAGIVRASRVQVNNQHWTLPRPCRFLPTDGSGNRLHSAISTSPKSSTARSRVC